MSAFKELPAFAQGLPKFEDHERQQTRYTTCYMCACRCGIKVTLENERIRFGSPERSPCTHGRVFEDTEDRRFSECASPAFTFYALSTEVGLIHFDLARERRLRTHRTASAGRCATRPSPDARRTDLHFSGPAG